MRKRYILLFVIALVAFRTNSITKEEELMTAFTYSGGTLDTLEIESEFTFKMTKEIEWATRLIQSEALNEPQLGKVAVVQTILNRIEYNNKYRNKNTNLFKEISRKGQVDGYLSNYWKKELKRENVLIAYKALYGYRLVPKSVYYWHNSKISTDRHQVRWAEGKDQKNVWKTIGNHTFCHSPKLLNP